MRFTEHELTTALTGAAKTVVAARRKSLLINCARLASERLARIEDPDFVEFP